MWRTSGRPPAREDFAQGAESGPITHVRERGWAVGQDPTLVDTWPSGDESLQINRDTNAKLALKNHLMWWNLPSGPELPGQHQPASGCGGRYFIKLTEVNAWADASRRKEHVDEGADVGEGAHSAETEMFENPLPANNMAT